MSVVEIVPRQCTATDSGSESDPEDSLCGDLRCPRCLDSGSRITVWIFTSEKAPLKWSARPFKLNKNGNDQLFYNLAEDPHLIHLMDIPAKRYLVYRAAIEPKQSEWVTARVGRPEKISPKSSIVVYHAERIDPFFCDGMGNILGMVHEQMVGQCIPEETARKSDNQASSLSEEQQGDNGIEIIPSSQESMDGDIPLL